MPKTYTKNTWTDEELADDALYDILESDDTPINEGVKIQLATDVIVAGTNVTAERMNNIEEGIDGLDDKMVVTDDYLYSADAPVKLSTNSPRIITATGDWTKPDNLAYIIVEIVGGGGGGGGVTGASSQAACANGGGGGEYAKKKILASALGGTETVTIGAVGAGGAAGNNNGGDGGNCSFGSHFNVVGGKGGAGEAASATVPRSGAVGGGQGGTGGTGGDLHIPGGNAIPGACWSTTQVSPSVGGASFWAGNIRSTSGLGIDEAGTTGKNWGGGGTGARSSNDANDRAGGDGGAGLVIVWEYIYGVEP